MHRAGSILETYLPRRWDSLPVRPPFRRALRSALAWRCPNCGRGPLFRGWFRLHRRCPLCGLRYYRESGYFTGAMYLDYAVSAAVVASLYFLSLLLPDFTAFSPDTKRLLWIAFGILVALAFMRHAYSFWLAMDFYFSPWEPELPEGSAHPPAANRLLL
jgi:uncharacterized protein (DUF983 family)